VPGKNKLKNVYRAVIPKVSAGHLT